MRLAWIFAAALASLALSCESQTGDRHSEHGIPPPSGTGKSIRELRDPAVPGQAEQVGKSHDVTGVIVLAVDAYNETQDNAVGTIYVQDVAGGAYSGLTLFAPTFNPANLRVGPGDVLDMRAQYQELQRIPSATPVVFAPGSFIPQLVFPTATFRYETRVPEPTDIDVNDLADYATGGKWIGMLVRVKNVTLFEDALRANERGGRLAIDLLPPPPNPQNGCDLPFPKVPELSNELFDLAEMKLTQGTTLKSVVGVVSFFCTLKIAPRSAADIER
ncbi:MAG: hypothetical protein KF819_00585 [Labilithrix sp.]|nr:hypothetical protein [Labilithrix sp.]